MSRIQMSGTSRAVTIICPGLYMMPGEEVLGAVAGKSESGTVSVEPGVSAVERCAGVAEYRMVRLSQCLICLVTGFRKVRLR